MSLDPKELAAQAKNQLISNLEREDPQLALRIQGDGWLDDMLLNFFSGLARAVGDLFLTLTEPLKNAMKDLGTRLYKSGIDRLQPEPPITMDKLIDIAGDATADAIAEQVLIMSGAVVVQLIPFLNVSAINQLLTLYADLSPDTEIARVITRTMVKNLIGDPIGDFYLYKYRPKRMSRSDAEACYKAGDLSKEGFTEILAYQGHPDSDIERILATTDREKAAKTKTPPATPTEFEALQGQIALLDSWDGLFTKWLTDLKARRTEHQALIKETEALGSPDALKKAEDLKGRLTQFNTEEREAWAQREKLLTVLSSLRRTYAKTVYNEALAVIKEHTALAIQSQKEIDKEFEAVKPEVPVDKLEMGKGLVPELTDLGKAFEKAVIERRFPTVVADPRVPMLEIPAEETKPDIKAGSKEAQAIESQGKTLATKLGLGYEAVATAPPQVAGVLYLAQTLGGSWSYIPGLGYYRSPAPQEAE